jgi:hypothetical protein
MAGGMNKRGSFRTPMAQRVSFGRPTSASDDDCPARHCWAIEPADGSGIRRPGLLLEWRQTGDRLWLGRVIYAAQVRAGEWATLEHWMPAAHMEPTERQD